MSEVQQKQSAQEIIEHFNEVFNTHDVDRIMELMTDDVVFENTDPAPDGERYVGAQAVHGFWTGFFNRFPRAVFEAEDMFCTEDRCFVAWRFIWNPDGPTSDDPGYIRGVDVFRLRDGKVSEKFCYVKDRTENWRR